MSNLLKKELLADSQTYGDDRRSPLHEREEAKALSENELVSAEPVTIVLSQMGWVRSAKGHDIDPAGLSYKAGDSYRAAARQTTSRWRLLTPPAAAIRWIRPRCRRHAGRVSRSPAS